MTIVTELLRDSATASNLGGKVLQAEDEGVVAYLFGVPVGFQFGTALGIENPIARIAVDILTDPLTYLTGGIGGLTKLGRAIKTTKGLTAGNRAAQTRKALELAGKAADQPQLAADLLRAASVNDLGAFNKAAKAFNDVPLTGAVKDILKKNEIRDLTNLFDVVNKSEGLKTMELAASRQLQAAAGERALLQLSVPFTNLQAEFVRGTKVFAAFDKIGPKVSKAIDKSGNLGRSLALKSGVTPIGQIPLLNRTLESGRSVLTRLLGPQGKELAEVSDKVREYSQRLQGRWGLQLQTALRGLSKVETKNLVEALDLGKKAMNEKVTIAATSLRGMLDDIFRLSDETLSPGQLEGSLKFRDNYFPHMFNDEFYQNIGKAGDFKEKIIDDLMKSGNWQTRNKASDYLDRLLAKNKGRIFSNVEQERLFNVDGWIKEPAEALSAYVQKASRRISEATHFGIGDEIPNGLIASIAKQGGDAGFAQRFLNDFVGNTLKDNPEVSQVRRFVDWVNSFEIVTKLGLAQVTNAPQGLVNTAMASNVRIALKAFRESFTKEGRDWALEAGATASSVFDDLKQTAVGSHTARKISSKFLRFTGFNAVETANRVQASMGGRLAAKHAAEVVTGIRKGNKQRAQKTLRKLGVDPMDVKLRKDLHKADPLNNPLVTRDELLTASLRMSNTTQFQSDILELPEFFRSPWGRMFTQFKSFAFNHAKFVGNIVADDIRSIKAGDASVIPGFLAKIGFALVAGEITTDVRMALTGKNPAEREANANRLVENFGRVGGMGIFTDAMNSAARGERGVFSFLGGPFITDVARTTGAIGFKAQEGGIPGAIQEGAIRGVGFVPFAGRPAAKALRSGPGVASTVDVGPPSAGLSGAEAPPTIEPFNLLERLKVGPPR